MLSDAAWDVIYRWVLAKFDLTTDEIADEVRWYFKSHGPTLADYHGVYLWRMERVTIISTPSTLNNEMIVTLIYTYNQPGGVISALDLDDPFDAIGEPVFWNATLGARVERIVGPSYQGFCDADSFRPVDTLGARPLTPADQPALARFVAACPLDDWRDSAIASEHLIYGVTAPGADEAGGELIALASVPAEGAALLPGGVYSIGVATLPARRRRGAGRAVVSALTAHCLAAGALPHYQTLRANHAAVAIARALGYADTATALAVRLNASPELLT